MYALRPPIEAPPQLAAYPERHSELPFAFVSTEMVEKEELGEEDRPL
jgi:hypothetical protein